jgi:hypothetical protein
MVTMKIFVFLFLLSNLFAAPATYYVLPADRAMAVDGSLSDWSSIYYLDTIESDNNIFFRDSPMYWTSQEFNGELYAAWDNDWIYFAVKITQDDAYFPRTGAGDLRCYDNLRLHPGGCSMAAYIGSDGSYYSDPSNPYTVNSTLFYGVSTTGNNGLPIYEFRIDKNLLDPFQMYVFQLSIGSIDNDTEGDCQDRYDLGFGVDYRGDKQDSNSGQCGNPLYYPTFHLADSIPPGTETHPLKAYYPFNGNANDESGNGNHGIVYGARLTTDRFGNRRSAFEFLASAKDYIEVADNVPHGLKFLKYRQPPKALWRNGGIPVRTT